MSMFLGTAISGGASDPPAPIANVTGRRMSLLRARAAAPVDNDCDPLAEAVELVAAPELEELVAAPEREALVAAPELEELVAAPER